MPIRPENRARYPSDWESVVVPRIWSRSGGRCECTGHCGIDHGGNGIRCAARNGFYHPVTGSVVVLTVMHLNHKPEDCRDENLLHGCQRCHNTYDAPQRRKGIVRRAREAIAATMSDLFKTQPGE